MTHALDAILEIFSWIGVGAALVLGVLALLMWVADSAWVRTDAVVDHEDGRTVLRWFTTDGADSAIADDVLRARLDGVSETTVWYHHGGQGRVRLTPHAHALRGVVIGALAMAGLALVCGSLSLVLLFVRG